MLFLMAAAAEFSEFSVSTSIASSDATGTRTCTQI
jgi:hypothetical protein